MCQTVSQPALDRVAANVTPDGGPMPERRHVLRED